MDKGTEGFSAREVSLSLIDFGDLMHLCVRRMKILLTLLFMMKSNET